MIERADGDPGTGERGATTRGDKDVDKPGALWALETVVPVLGRVGAGLSLDRELLRGDADRTTEAGNGGTGGID